MFLLDITLTNGWLALIIIAIIVIAIGISSTLSTQKDSYHKLEMQDLANQNRLKEKELVIEKIQTDSKAIAQDLAIKQFDEWKKSELDKYIKIIEDAGIEKAAALLGQWKVQEEERIRKDAANRSVRNVLGKVTEHLIPFSEAMKNFNPKDIRFIGSPIDLIVFDGAEELKKDQVTITFIEVKTGSSALSKRQQVIKDAVINKRVNWLRVNMKDFGEEVNSALAE